MSEDHPGPGDQSMMKTNSPKITPFQSYHTVHAQMSRKPTGRAQFLYAHHHKGSMVEGDPGANDMQGYSQWVLENSGNRQPKPLNNPSFSLQRRFYNHPKSHESAPGPKYQTSKTFEAKHAWSMNGNRHKSTDERDSFVHGHISRSGMLSAVSIRPLSEDPRLVAPGRYRTEEAALKIRPRSSVCRFSYSRKKRFDPSDPHQFPGAGTYTPCERTAAHRELWHPSGPNFGPKPRIRKMTKSQSAAQLTRGRSSKTMSAVSEDGEDGEEGGTQKKNTLSIDEQARRLAQAPERKKRKNIKRRSTFIGRNIDGQYISMKFDKKGIFRGQDSPGPANYALPTDNWRVKNKPPRAVTVANAWR
jgi:hypothetical protein